MMNYDRLVERIVSDIGRKGAEGKVEECFREIVNQLKISHKQISDRQCRNDVTKSKTYQLLGKVVEINGSEWYNALHQFLELLYLKESSMLMIVYQFMPAMLRAFIQGAKNAGLQKVMRLVHSYELGSFSRVQEERQDLKRNPFARELYEIHFSLKLEEGGEESKLMEEGAGEQQPGREKVVVLFVVYRELQKLCLGSLKEYLKLIYIYCGGEMKSYNSLSSVYLLQKKNLFNPFKYAISEGEIEWMLLVLYELSIGGRVDKYEVLAAVNMIYKKTANQSMFRFAEIAQSIIHLLEDQYTDIFG